MNPGPPLPVPAAGAIHPGRSRTAPGGLFQGSEDMSLHFPQAAEPKGQGTQPGVILVLGSWSSGSTALTGYIARRGAWTCPPHQLTNDPRTPDSHESKEFRDALCACVDELTLGPIRPAEDFERFFGPWLETRRAEARSAGRSSIVLKHPLAAFMLQPILRICDPRIVIVTRSFAAIEASRRRRGWHPVYGVEGARQIYGVIFSRLIDHGRSFCTVSYTEFLENKSLRRSMSSELGLDFSAESEAAAEVWLRTNTGHSPQKAEVSR